MLVTVDGFMSTVSGGGANADSGVGGAPLAIQLPTGCRLFPGTGTDSTAWLCYAERSVM